MPHHCKQCGKNFRKYKHREQHERDVHPPKRKRNFASYGFSEYGTADRYLFSRRISEIAPFDIYAHANLAIGQLFR